MRGGGGGGVVLPMKQKIKPVVSISKTQDSVNEEEEVVWYMTQMHTSGILIMYAWVLKWNI